MRIQGDAHGTVIVTGDGNRINLTRHPQDGPFFHLLDEAFRLFNQAWDTYWQERRVPSLAVA